MAITLDGTSGVTTPAETITTNLTFTGTGNRITGDMSNATVASRVLFQTSTANSNTNLQVIPSGTAQQAAMGVFNNSDPTNASASTIIASATESSFRAGLTGTGTYLPMTFFTGGSERARIDTSGNLLFNSGYGSAATAYGCRAWVNFNGTGTVAIRASGNVSSITDNGTGNYTVNFTTAMVDVNYSAVASGGDASTDGRIAVTTTLATSSYRVYTRLVDNTLYDTLTVSTAAFR